MSTTGLYIGDTAIGKINVGTFSENGYDTSTATAGASDILTGKTAFGASGKVNGTMPNNGAVGETLNTSSTTYIVPKGYHNGSGSVSISLEEKTVTPSTTIQTVTPTAGKVLSKVIVNAVKQGGITPSGTINITTNGTYDVTAYASASVNVQSDGSSGIDTSDATITSGGQLLSGVTAYGADGKITGTITSRGAETITPSETAQTIPAGVYLSGTQTISAISKTHVGSGVTKQAAKTITPSTSTQTAVTSGVYTTGAITVNPIPSQYIITTDATAVANNIVSGKTAYVNGSKVTGTLVVQRYYTGSSAPSSSLGNDGDIYLRS